MQRVDVGEAYAGIELGGTKLLCRVTDGTGEVLADGRFATSTPAQALDDLTTGLRAALGRRQLRAIGVASFGPLVVDPHSAHYGQLLATPKPGWSGFDLHGALRQHFSVPLVIETDVGAAAIAEQARGAGRGLSCVAYVTVGTGIGGGLVLGQSLLKGALHPEVGHMRLRRRSGDAFMSTCRFHEDCAEGLASGPAVARRLPAGLSLEQSPQVLALVGDYLGDLAANLLLAWSPQRLVFGGGLLGVPGLLARIDASMRVALGSYGAGVIAGAGYVAPAQLAHPGLEGALILAQRLSPAGC